MKINKCQECKGSGRLKDRIILEDDVEYDPADLVDTYSDCWCCKSSGKSQVFETLFSGLTEGQKEIIVSVTEEFLKQAAPFCESEVGMDGYSPGVSSIIHDKWPSFADKDPKDNLPDNFIDVADNRFVNIGGGLYVRSPIQNEPTKADIPDLGKKFDGPMKRPLFDTNYPDEPV